MDPMISVAALIYAVGWVADRAANHFENARRERRYYEDQQKEALRPKLFCDECGDRVKQPA